MRTPAMQVTFVDSVQGHQTARVRETAARLAKARPEVTVSVIEGDAAKATLAQYKLKYGPAVVIDGRLEYVGVPRWRFLQERIAQVAGKIPNPRSSAPPTPPAPPKAAPAAPAAAKPAAPAAPPATPPKPSTTADSAPKAGSSG